MSHGELAKLRRDYHRRIVSDVLRLDASKIPNNADRGSKSSVSISQGIAERIGGNVEGSLAGQTAGGLFEAATRDFLASAFNALHHLRPGDWELSLGGDIGDYQQYQHLNDVKRAIEENQALRVVFGDYIVKPDIVVCRRPVEDAEINRSARVLGDDPLAGLTPLRRTNSQVPILHASVSCKWTLRSDRSQNARTEGLNLIRNRKGPTPRVVVVVGEPLPARIASIALGTGDIDCVYHFALSELKGSAMGSDLELLNVLVDGQRLRDISDLPFDLAT